MAGNDLLVADKGDTAALFGNDSVAGEALLGFAGTATANNAATATQGDAGIALALTGNDDITLGYGDDVAAGEALALGNNGHALANNDAIVDRSEEHTSELQSLMRISYAVFCLKKKKKKQ